MYTEQAFLFRKLYHTFLSKMHGIIYSEVVGYLIFLPKLGRLNIGLLWRS